MAFRILYASSPAWAAVANQLDEILDQPDFRRLKQTSRTLAGIVRINDTEVFLKRVNSINWRQGFSDRIRGSRARRALRGAALLQRAGFAHPAMLAAFDCVRWGAVESSYVITQALQRPRIPSRQALADGRDFAWRQWFSGALARTIRGLHDAGCYTHDMQETNLLVEADGRKLTVYFLDLEDFRSRRRVSEPLRMRNLIHLDRSIGRFLSRSQRLRFLYQYLGDRPERAERRRIVARIGQIRGAIEHRKRRHARAQAIIMPAAGSIEKDPLG